jgi:hypothetical protein
MVNAGRSLDYTPEEKIPSRVQLIVTIVSICLTLCSTALALYTTLGLMNTHLLQAAWIASSIGVLIGIVGLPFFGTLRRGGYACQILSCALLWCVNAPIAWAFVQAPESSFDLSDWSAYEYILASSTGLLCLTTVLLLLHVVVLKRR